MGQIKGNEAKADMDRLLTSWEPSREEYRRILAFYSEAGLVYTPVGTAAKRRFAANLDAELEASLEGEQ